MKKGKKRLPNLPATFIYTESCWIEVSSRRFLIWTWRAIYEGNDLPSEEDIVEEYVEDNDSESEGDDTVVLDTNDQIDTDDEDLG